MKRNSIEDREEQEDHASSSSSSSSSSPSKKQRKNQRVQDGNKIPYDNVAMIATTATAAADATTAFTSDNSDQDAIQEAIQDPKAVADQLQQFFDNQYISQVLSKEPNAQLQTKFRQAIESVRKSPDEQIQIALFGAPGFGKSATINHLLNLGVDLLPARIQHGKGLTQAACVVQFADTISLDIVTCGETDNKNLFEPIASLEQSEQYRQVAQLIEKYENDPEIKINRLRSHFLLSVPSEFLREQKVRLVDLPGIEANISSEVYHRFFHGDFKSHMILLFAGDNPRLLGDVNPFVGLLDAGFFSKTDMKTTLPSVVLVDRTKTTKPGRERQDAYNTFMNQTKHALLEAFEVNRQHFQNLPKQEGNNFQPLARLKEFSSLLFKVEILTDLFGGLQVIAQVDQDNPETCTFNTSLIEQKEFVLKRVTRKVIETAAEQVQFVITEVQSQLQTTKNASRDWPASIKKAKVKNEKFLAQAVKAYDSLAKGYDALQDSWLKAFEGLDESTPSTISFDEKLTKLSEAFAQTFNEFYRDTFADAAALLYQNQIFIIKKWLSAQNNGRPPKDKDPAKQEAKEQTKKAAKTACDEQIDSIKSSIKMLYGNTPSFYQSNDLKMDLKAVLKDSRVITGDVICQLIEHIRTDKSTIFPSTEALRKESRERIKSIWSEFQIGGNRLVLGVDNDLSKIIADVQKALSFCQKKIAIYLPKIHKAARAISSDIILRLNNPQIDISKAHKAPAVETDRIFRRPFREGNEVYKINSKVVEVSDQNHVNICGVQVPVVEVNFDHQSQIVQFEFDKKQIKLQRFNEPRKNCVYPIFIPSKLRNMDQHPPPPQFHLDIGLRQNDPELEDFFVVPVIDKSDYDKQVEFLQKEFETLASFLEKEAEPRTLQEYIGERLMIVVIEDERLSFENESLPFENEGLLFEINVGRKRTIIKLLAEDILGLNFYWSIDDDIDSFIEYNRIAAEQKCTMARALTYCQIVMDAERLPHPNPPPEFVEAILKAAGKLCDLGGEENFKAGRRLYDLASANSEQKRQVVWANLEAFLQDLGEPVAKEIRTDLEDVVGKQHRQIAQVAVSKPQRYGEYFEQLRGQKFLSYKGSLMRYQVVLFNSSACRGVNYLTSSDFFVPKPKPVANYRRTKHCNDEDKQWASTGYRREDRVFADTLKNYSRVGFVVFRVGFQICDPSEYPTLIWNPDLPTIDPEND